MWQEFIFKFLELIPDTKNGLQAVLKKLKSYEVFNYLLKLKIKLKSNFVKKSMEI